MKPFLKSTIDRESKKNSGTFSGMLSNNDILNAMKDKEIIITDLKRFDPYSFYAQSSGVGSDLRLTPAGFNFSFTRFIVSLKSSSLYPIYLREKLDRNELFFTIMGGDTALTLTYESIWVSRYIAGTFHAKVKNVSCGLGSISTTLDPGWQGQLLIAINNPNSFPIDVVIGSIEKDKEINIDNISFNSFITLCLYRLQSPSDINSDNDNARLQLLSKALEGTKDATSKEIVEIITDMLKVQGYFDMNQGSNPSSEALADFEKKHAALLRRLDQIQPPVIKLCN